MSEANHLCTNEPDEQEDPEVLGLETLNIFKAMARDNKARLEERKKKLLETPPITCRSHGTPRPVSVERSLQANYEFVYEACPDCELEKLNDILIESGVPDLLLDAEFDNWLPSKEDPVSHMEFVRKFAHEDRKGFLFLLGENKGTGKSYLAVAAAKHWGSLLFITQDDLLEQHKASYAKRGKDGKYYHEDDAPESPVAKAQSVSLLILDEMGRKDSVRSDELDIIHQILCHRYNKKMATIITSNRDYKSLLKLFGERVASRINQSIYALLTFNGKDRRADARSNYFK